MATFICHGCGQRANGNKYTYNGKSYCYTCFQKLSQDLEQQENQKQELIEYIKFLYGVVEISPDILSGIEREINSGKKPKGILLTLKYYYEIEGNTPNISNIIYVIRDQYINAKNYIREINKIQKKNSEIDLNVPPVNIRINLNSLQKKSRKSTINIADL